MVSFLRSWSLGYIFNTHLLCFYIKLGDWVVATENCTVLNDNLGKHPKIETFMVGQVVTIRDEITYEVLVEVYPDKRFVFKNDMNFITPFVSCETFNEPIYCLPRFNLKEPSRKVIKNYYSKIKKSKRLKKTIKFLKSKIFSSK